MLPIAGSKVAKCTSKMCYLLVTAHNLQGTELMDSVESTVLTHRRSTHACDRHDSQQHCLTSEARNRSSAAYKINVV